MNPAKPGSAFVSGAPTHKTLGQVLSSAEPILGRNHEVCQLLIHAMVDQDALASVWAAIEALPPSTRRLLAVALGETIIGS